MISVPYRRFCWSLTFWLQVARGTNGPPPGVRVRKTCGVGDRPIQLHAYGFLLAPYWHTVYVIPFLSYLAGSRVSAGPRQDIWQLLLLKLMLRRAAKTIIRTSRALIISSIFQTDFSTLNEAIAYEVVNCNCIRVGQTDTLLEPDK